ncbi:hypothetical protein L208DRAFT_1264622 [Tricholoma matsutake]|nr:hypothetical protein L208DRAFT_1264622 [Tricholoma matsutake 945]
MHANIVSEDNECSACSKYFQTIQGRNAHLSTAHHCKWWKKGKLSEFGLSTHDTEMLEIVDGVFGDLEDQEDLFYFIPDTDVQMGEPGPGPSSSRVSGSYRQPTSSCMLDDEDDERIEEVHPTAGKMFGEAEIGAGSGSDGSNTVMDDSSANPYYPFASELDWRIMWWVVKDGLGHNAFDRLLSIPGSFIFAFSINLEKLGLSFSNIHGLHQMVDAILDRAGTWRSRTLSFKDTPEDQFIVHYRDVVEAVWSLWVWGDSSFSKELVTAP